MNWRFLPIATVCACFLAAGATSASAQGMRPGGPPPGSPLPGIPPAGGPPPGWSGASGLGGLPNGSFTQHSASANSSRALNGGLRLGPAGRWWDDKTTMQTIGLRREQQRSMDAIFNANKPAILASYKTLLSEKSKLEEISRDSHVDQVKLFAAIDAVSQARAALQKATSQMLLQIRQQMDPGQIQKLKVLP